MPNGIIWLLTISYPFLVWFSLDYLQPRYLALFLVAVYLLRLLSVKSGETSGSPWSKVFPACVFFLLLVALVNEIHWLQAYPVFVSLVFFCVFAYSLAYPPTIVERLARLEDPDLPPQGIAYTRKVTMVWCGFFMLNAIISLATVWYGDAWLWSLYNGIVSYVLMGVLMAIEMVFRRKIKASY